MDASRLRLGSAADWTAAVLLLVATVGVTLLILHAMTTIDAPASAPQGTSSVVVPAGLPALSIPVSMLKLSGGRQIRLGDRLPDVSMLLGREAETGAQVVEECRTGLRLTRGYEDSHLRFTIVFEPFERNGEFRIAGIYVQ